MIEVFGWRKREYHESDHTASDPGTVGKMSQALSTDGVDKVVGRGGHHRPAWPSQDC